MLFSIAIPAYKGKYLKECISSILGQTHKKFELIIVNDFSPDPIDEIVVQFIDERIKYFKNETNIGAENLVNNWNACLKKATGDFFIMMGDDDKMESNFLEEFVKLIERYPTVDVYHCRSKIIDEDSVPFNFTPSWPEFESVYENIYHRLMEYRHQYVSDFVYRRQALVDNGGFYYLPLAWGSDDITAYLACGNKGIAHTNTPVFNYRSNRYSISSSGNDGLKMKAICLEKEWYSNFMLKVPVDANDKIFWSEIKRILNKRIQKKKAYTITTSLAFNPIVKIRFWYVNRKIYHYSMSELVYAILQHIVNKKSKSRY